jgi:hypothetical protein
VLLCARLKSGVKHPLKESFRIEVDGPVRALAFVSNELVTLIGDHVSLRSGRGDKILRDLVVEGAVAMALLPEKAGIAVPAWDEE